MICLLHAVAFFLHFNTGAGLIESGRAAKVLVIGSDKMSSITDYTDRKTCVLFGDGAAGVLLEADSEGYGLIDSELNVDGRGWETLCMLGGGSLNPTTHDTVDRKMHYLHQDGQAVFKVAVKGMADVAVEIMKRKQPHGRRCSVFGPPSGKSAHHWRGSPSHGSWGLTV